MVCFRSKVCSYQIRKTQNIEPVSWTERLQQRCFGKVNIMPQEMLARPVLLATLAEKRPRVRPRTNWGDYIVCLAWWRVGVKKYLEASCRQQFSVVNLLLSNWYFLRRFCHCCHEMWFPLSNPRQALILLRFHARSQLDIRFHFKSNKANKLYEIFASYLYVYDRFRVNSKLR